MAHLALNVWIYYKNNAITMKNGVCEFFGSLILILNWEVRKSVWPNKYGIHSKECMYLCQEE